MDLPLRYRFRWLSSTLLATPLGLFLWVIPPAAQAQTCPYASLRLESSHVVNSDTICQAAKPWSDQGYQVFVYLTDQQPATEDAWYALLDQVEADAGLRDLSLPDSFKKNGLALAAQTAASSYEVSVTYGETLYNTPIDTSPEFEGIKQNIRVKLSRGEAEAALIYGLQDMYILNHASERTAPAVSTPEPVAAIPQPLQPSVAQSPLSSPSVVSQEPIDAPWGGIGAGTGLLSMAGLGLWQYRRQRQLKQQRQELQTRIATLLMACNDLLADGGSGPTGTILYSLFEAARGRLYPDLEKQVLDWLNQARQALDQSFIVQDELQQQQPRWLRNNHVQSWEELYLILIGSKLYHEKLTDEELRVVLDPMQTLSAYRWENQLAAPLKKIQQQLAGAPLSIELMVVGPTTFEDKSLGILGTLQQIKEKIAQLRRSETEAPQMLATMRTHRQTTASVFPTGLTLSVDEAFQGIDTCLTNANNALDKTRFLDTLAHCESAQRGLTCLTDYSNAIANHRQHQTDIQEILNQGFRPPQHTNHQSALGTCLAAGQQPIAAGDYGEIPEHIAELERLDKAALYHAQQWQQLYYDNHQEIERLTNRLAQLQADCDGTAAATWQTLQTYPAENWQCVETCLPTARQILALVQQQDLPAVTHLNNFDQQSFYGARDGLDVVSNKLETAEKQLVQLQQQAELIEKMSIMLTELIENINVQIKAVNQVGQGGLLGLFRGKDPRLQQAVENLSTAHNYIQERYYVSAIAVHDQAGQTMLMVYREKLDAIASQVNRLINNYDARNHGRSDYDAALRCIPSQTTIAQASVEEIHKLYSDLAKAWDLLKSARRSAKAEIRRQEERRRRARERRESSSSSSFGSSRRSSSSRSSSSGSSRRSSSSHGSSRRR